MEFENRVVVVTGAAGGIGRATAKLMAEQGARVVLADQEEKVGRATADEIGRGAVFVKTDVGDSGDVSRLFTEVDRLYGRVDVLFNNAGVESTNSLLETSEEEWDRVLRINLKGIFLCSKEAALRMKRRNRGAIVHTASERGLVGSENSLSYSASKGGVVIIAKSMALDLAPYGIRVNCVCPGATDTGMLRRDLAGQPDPEAAMRQVVGLQPLGGLGQPLDVAYAVAFLASDQARYITGIALPVDGGFTAR